MVPLLSVIPSTLAGIQNILNYGINTFWFPVKVEGMTDERVPAWIIIISIIVLIKRVSPKSSINRVFRLNTYNNDNTTNNNNQRWYPSRQ